MFVTFCMKIRPLSWSLVGPVGFGVTGLFFDLLTLILVGSWSLQHSRIDSKK